MRRDPRTLGQDRSRWTLASIRAACDWLRLRTDGGLSRLLRRLAIHLKRGRDYLHSPDPDYEAKRAAIGAVIERARAEPTRYVVVFLDEVTYTRQPTLERDYEAAGAKRPLARRSLRSDTQRRLIGALNALTGQVTYLHTSRTNISALRRFYRQLRAVYPQAETIYVVLDNGPVHFHPNVLAALQPQTLPYRVPTPPNWPSEVNRKVAPWNLPITLVQLPTYASWLNPIEKLWRWLRQDVLHLHRLADDGVGLHALVETFLDPFAAPSLPLRRYTGLFRL